MTTLTTTLNLHQCIKRGLRLLKEVSLTRRSISNFNKIIKSFELSRMSMYYTDSSNVIIHTEWITSLPYTDILFTWDFKGFSVGYGGEGPRGFKQVIDKLNELGYDIKFNPLDRLDSNEFSSGMPRRFRIY